MQKLNCWQFKNCGREKGGLLVHAVGECPVSAMMKYDGINEGRGAGRVCWKVPKHPSSACYAKACHTCEFYRRVNFEEAADTSGRFASVPS